MCECVCFLYSCWFRNMQHPLWLVGMLIHTFWCMLIIYINTELCSVPACFVQKYWELGYRCLKFFKSCLNFFLLQILSWNMLIKFIYSPLVNKPCMLNRNTILWQRVYAFRVLIYMMFASFIRVAQFYIIKPLRCFCFSPRIRNTKRQSLYSPSALAKCVSTLWNRERLYWRVIEFD